MKTDKGLEEIQRRAHGLPQKLRTLLIMVDGKSTVGDLLGRFPGVTEIETNLQRLVVEGFVALGGDASQGVPAASPAPAAGAAPGLPSPPPGETRPQALSALTRSLIEALGPAADMVTGDIEQARTRAEFEMAAGRCASMLEGVAGERKATAFRERARQFADRFL